MAGEFPHHRTEKRTSLKILVELYSFDNAAFEFANTMDVSRHGARVTSKMPWAPQQRVSVRSVTGDLNSRARVVYCQRLPDEGYAVGLELYQPTEDWPGIPKAYRAMAGA